MHSNDGKTSFRSIFKGKTYHDRHEQSISDQDECTHGESTTSKCKGGRQKRHTSVAGLREHNFNRRNNKALGKCKCPRLCNDWSVRRA